MRCIVSVMVGFVTLAAALKDYTRAEAVPDRSEARPLSDDQPP